MFFFVGFIYRFHKWFVKPENDINSHGANNNANGAKQREKKSMAIKEERNLVSVYKYIKPFWKKSFSASYAFLMRLMVAPLW